MTKKLLIYHGYADQEIHEYVEETEMGNRIDYLSAMGYRRFNTRDIQEEGSEEYM